MRLVFELQAAGALAGHRYDLGPQAREIPRAPLVEPESKISYVFEALHLAARAGNLISTTRLASSIGRAGDS